MWAHHFNGEQAVWTWVGLRGHLRYPAPSAALPITRSAALPITVSAALPSTICCSAQHKICCSAQHGRCQQQGFHVESLHAALGRHLCPAVPAACAGAVRAAAPECASGCVGGGPGQASASGPARPWHQGSSCRPACLSGDQRVHDIKIAAAGLQVWVAVWGWREGASLSPSPGFKSVCGRSVIACSSEGRLPVGVTGSTSSTATPPTALQVPLPPLPLHPLPYRFHCPHYHSTHCLTGSNSPTATPLTALQVPLPPLPLHPLPYRFQFPHCYSTHCLTGSTAPTALPITSPPLPHHPLSCGSTASTALPITLPPLSVHPLPYRFCCLAGLACLQVPVTTPGTAHGFVLWWQLHMLPKSLPGAEGDAAQHPSTSEPILLSTAPSWVGPDPGESRQVERSIRPWPREGQAGGKINRALAQGRAGRWQDQ